MERKSLSCPLTGLILTSIKYPVITAHVPSAERWLGSDPDLITTSTNRNLLQPTRANKARRESKNKIRLDKGKRRGTGDSTPRSRAPILNEMIREESSSSIRSGQSQLVDLVIEDTVAEETERVRARKEGGSGWNYDEPRHFIRTYEDEHEGQEIRSGFEPGKASSPNKDEFAIGDDDAPDDEGGADDNNNGLAEESDEAREWKKNTSPQHKNSNTTEEGAPPKSDLGPLEDGHSVWKVSEEDEGK